MTNRYCVTYNNYPDEIKDNIEQMDIGNIQYLIFGYEVAPTTGTPHVQGFIHLKRSRTIVQLKKDFSFLRDAHFIEASGSDIDNQKYCSKDGDYQEIGEPSTQGKRTDLAEIKDLMLNQGKRVRDVLPLIGNYQQLKFAEALQKYQKPLQSYKKKKIFWYYGQTGTGKTRRALKNAEGYGDFWISSRGLKWWDGYTGQKVVVIDDFRGDFCTFHELLRILDGYPFRAEVKGSSLWLDAECIFITSPYHPNDVYSTIEDKSQLLRRITKIRKF